MNWTVKSKTAGKGKLIFWYALGSGERPLKLLVNGKDAGPLPFVSTGGWHEWKDLAADAELVAGENNILLETIAQSGPNIDHLQVVEP